MYTLYILYSKIIIRSILVKPQILSRGFILTTFMDMIGQKGTDPG